MATYYEIMVKGDRDIIYAYLKGFLTARNAVGDCYFSREVPMKTHHLREFIKFHGEALHLVCAASLRAPVESAIRRAPEQFDLEIMESNRVAAASFGFRFETASRDVAPKIKRALGRLPSGVKLEDYEPEEIVDPGAKGPEVYTPVHDYVFQGEGRATGDVAGVVALRARLDAIEFFTVDEIEIHRQG